MRGAAGLPAPTVLPAASGMPKAVRVATPEVRILLGYTRRVLHLPDARTLAVFSFGSAPQSNRLFLIDSRDLSAKAVPVPNNDVGSHGAALGRDGIGLCQGARSARSTFRQWWVAMRTSQVRGDASLRNSCQ